MKSAFINLGDELKALLESPVIAGVGAVTRDRVVPVIRQTPFAINVVLDKSLGGQGGISGSPTDWVTDFLIELYARVETTGVATDTVDPLLLAVWERLSTASAYAGLIALGVQDVLPDPQIDWEPREGETPLIVAIVKTRIIHRTNPGALTPWDGSH